MECEIANHLYSPYADIRVRFRWVACQLDMLGDCFSLFHLRQALASLPKTLDDTYARILYNIDNQYNHYNRYVIKILQWLSFAARPLRLEELAEIVAIDVEETPRFDPERRWPEQRDILTVCSSLIALTDSYEESGSEFGANPREFSDSEGVMTYVRLAHFSVKEYLVSDRIDLGMASHYSIREMVAHGTIAEDCIAYILQFDEPGSLTPETLELSPLSQYAAQYWVYHARNSMRASDEISTRLSIELLMSDREGLLSWVRIADPDKFYHQDMGLGSDDLASPLYYASQAGLLQQVKMLMEGSVGVDAQRGRFGNALQVASDLGHEDIVKILLEKGADVNATGGASRSNESALQLASEHGYVNVVKMLLEKGADVNATGEDDWSSHSALQLALMHGYVNVVKILLEKGADVNAIDANLGSALQVASWEGYDNIVEMLLEKGADVNANSVRRLSALQLASREGHDNIVAMLLENGAVMPEEQSASSEEEDDSRVESLMEDDAIELHPGLFDESDYD